MRPRMAARRYAASHGSETLGSLAQKREGPLACYVSKQPNSVVLHLYCVMAYVT